MKAAEVSKYFGYGVAFTMASVGIVVLFGLLAFEAAPLHLRIMFGVILVLFGIYRFLATRTRAAQAVREDE